MKLGNLYAQRLPIGNLWDFESLCISYVLASAAAIIFSRLGTISS
jgi:hypothetical protein